MPGPSDLEEVRALNNRYDATATFSLALLLSLPTGPTTTAITALSQSGTTVTATANSHGLSVNDVVSVLGCTPAGYNGTYVVTGVTTNTFTYENPNITGLGSGSSFGWVGKVGDPVCIASISGNGTTVTVGTTTAHGFKVGMVVAVSGVSASGYNGSVTVASVADTTHFTYTNATSTAATALGGSYGSAIFGMCHNAVKVTGSAYADLAISASSSEWNAAVPGAPSTKTGPNSTKGTWAFPQATGNWTQACGTALLDTTVTNHQSLWIAQAGALSSPQQVNNGNQFQFDQTNQVTLQSGDPGDSF